jgi:hypothetical protein
VVPIKRKTHFIFISCFLLLITACTSNSQPDPSPFPEVKVPYSSEIAEQNGDVVHIFDKVLNEEKWKQFIHNVNEKSKDQVRITQYTIEGDPIFYELVYDGDNIKFTYDNSLDTNGSDRKRPSTLCKKIGTKQRETGHKYYSLVGCDNNTGDSFWFPKK